jgi:glutathione S-transferase
MIKVWGRRSSINVQKVLWALAEVGAAYDLTEAGGDFGGLDDPAFRAMNRNGLIPVLRDGETVVWESNAIVRYLAAKYGAGSLWPEDPGARAMADRWMDWSQSTFQRPFMDYFWGWYRTPAERRNAAENARFWTWTCAAIELLDLQLADRPFLAGETLTIADIPGGTQLYRYYGMEEVRPEAPNVAAWYRRLGEREGYRDHVMYPYDDLFGKLAF